MNDIKQRLLQYYEQHEVRVNLSFFVGGFLFDVITLASIDDTFSIFQQLIYLTLIGIALSAEILVPAGKWRIPGVLGKAWELRSAIVHFVLGSLLSIYSLFFLKSASVFSSLVFVALIMLVMIANEMKRVQARGDTKIGLYVICLFSFFSMMVPVLLGFVGWLPFLLALALTVLSLWGWYRFLLKRLGEPTLIQRQLLLPGAGVTVLFFGLYLLGWIPPVPLAVDEVGIYHQIKKSAGTYHLYHENPWYKPWNKGDQDFVAYPGDQLQVFAKIFSPARFNDTVILHWQKFSIEQGWQTTDRIPMRVTGGRVGGWRGHGSKANYTAGDWRIAIETTDGREIGRIPFSVTVMTGKAPSREFKVVQH